MVTHLGDLLDSARRQRFVGRGGELAGFDAALDGRSPTRVLFLHGEGGIGKTTLMAEFRSRALEAGRAVVLLDGRDVDPSPDGLRTAAGNGPCDVLLVDGYEQLAPIDGWLRDEFVPGLGAHTVVALAGRDAPTAPWRTDPGWRQLVTVYRLAHFDTDESGRLLEQAGVAATDRAQLMRLGRGHPLAMAVLADLAVSGTVPDTLADAPDLMSVLLESFVRDAPTEAHLTGLAACVIAWLTTEDLLARLVGAQAPEVWRWLASRPFINSGPRGLTIHDLARDVLDAEFERRAPERYHEYHRIIHAHTVAGLRNATGLDRQVHGQRLLFLLRNSPLTSAFAALRARGSASVVPGRPDEHDQVCAIVERFEGAASAGFLRSWLTEQPEHLSVVRAGDRVAGFAYHVFSPGGSSLEERDPVVRACLRHAHRAGPARPGELVNIARFIGGSQDNQRDPYAVLAACVSSLVEWLTRPLAWSFCTVVDDEYWAPLFDHAAFERVLAVDGYVALAIDWRRFPVDKWLALMRERGHSGGSGPPPTAILRPRPLDRDRFDAAVRAALPVLHRPDQLAASPLIGSALAATDAGPTVEQLRATIEAAVACLAQEPKGDQLRAVLNRTYLRPAANREAAAEVLGLPFSTYRRYLAKALEQLTDLLWTVEIGGVHL